MNYTKNQLRGPLSILFVCACFLLFPSGKAVLAEVSSLAPTVEFPNIETLTGGRVKMGDTIDKNNVDLVKDYLSEGLYADVMRGKILIIGNNLQPGEMIPEFFWEYTEKYKDKGIIEDDYGTIRLQDGSPWPGGLPFPDPKTGLEVMCNVQWGVACDDWTNVNQWSNFINKEGKWYTSLKMLVQRVWTCHRMDVPPIGLYPGLEDEMYRRLLVFFTPVDMKGLGQFAIVYYKRGADSDAGFAYLPAFRRAIRVSATTWQDNIGGGDLTYCDPDGMNDPFSYWNFKLVEKNKWILATASDQSPYATLSTPDGWPDPKATGFDRNHRFLTVRWALTPVHVVEVTPKIKHIYSKKVIYVDAPPFWVPTDNTCEMSMYDRAGKLWKSYRSWRGGVWKDSKGRDWGNFFGNTVHDLQTNHSNPSWLEKRTFNTGIDPNTINLKTLLQYGK